MKVTMRPKPTKSAPAPYKTGKTNKTAKASSGKKMMSSKKMKNC